MNDCSSSIVICNIDHSSFDKLDILFIMKDNNITLHEFSSDIYRIFKNPTLSNVYFTYLLEDIFYLRTLSSIDIPDSVIITELKQLVDEIQEKIDSIHIKNKNLRNIYLERKNILILEYR